MKRELLRPFDIIGHQWSWFKPSFPISAFFRVTAEENGHSFHTPQKGPPSEDTSVAASEVPETVSKSALPSHTIQASEEQSSTQTPVKKSSKLRQQIDIKAELEKRQGGKQLLNLVVIGNVLRSSGLSARDSPTALWVQHGDSCSALSFPVGGVDREQGGIASYCFPVVLGGMMPGYRGH